MADKKSTKKPASTAKKSSSSKKPASSRSGGAKSAPKKSAPARTSSAKPAPSDRDRERYAAKAAERTERKRRFVRYYLPYILGAVAIFLLICFVVDLFSEDNHDPSAHPMGVFGYFICHILFGLFTWSAYLIPVLLLVMVIFWQRYFRAGRVGGKIVASFAFILLCASLGQVIICTAQDAMSWNVPDMYNRGTDLQGGGVLGGLLGNVLFIALKLPGTIILDVITLPLIFMALLGITPWDAILKIRDKVAENREIRAEERAIREENESRQPARTAARRGSRTYEDEDEDDEDLDAVDDDEDEDEEELSANLRERNTRRDSRRDDRRRRIDRQNDRRTARNARYDEDDDEDAEDDRDERADRRGGRRSESVSDRAGNRSDERSDERTGERRSSRRKPNAAETAAEEETAEAREPHTLLVDARTGEVLESTEDDDAEASAAETDAAEASAAECSQMPSEEREGRRDGRRGDRRGDRRFNSQGERRTRPGQSARGEAEESSDDEDIQTPAAEDVPWDETPANPRTVADIHGEVEPMDEEDESMEYMEVDLEDDVPDETPARGHVETIEVHVNRPDRTVVTNTGMADEELVLPSGGSARNAAPATTEQAEPEPEREYLFPDIEMLTRGPDQYASNDEEIAENTQILRDVLRSFRIGVREISCSCGPTITRFEVKPDTGVRVRSISNLLDDIALGLAKAGVRIEAPIPGKSAVGIEVPNAEPDTVYLRNILETPEFRGHKSRIAACLGADVAGRPVILDINKMPHLLIAGATGTGKSVCINSLIMSILFKAKPNEVKLILIDPKKVEFAMYRDLPHLYAPVVSDPKKAAGALNSAVNEMERRFELIEEVGVRNLAGYNEITAGDPERPPLPQMVIIIDELADLMMTAPAEVETAICRLAQKARAAGIHLIIGTQRPSVDVITGLIKANVPSRIAFTVKSGVDSRTILDTVGAEKLIGRGDMLYAPIGSSKPIRAQGCFVSETEVERVVTFIKENNDPPVYNEEFTRSIDAEAAKCGGKKKGGDTMGADDFDSLGGGGTPDGEDPKFWEALEVAVTKDKIGTSALQRACNLGYGRAAKIIDRMEALGFVGPDPGTKQGRKVLISKQEYQYYRTHGLPTGRTDASDGADNGNEDAGFDDDID